MTYVLMRTLNHYSVTHSLTVDYLTVLQMFIPAYSSIITIIVLYQSAHVHSEIRYRLPSSDVLHFSLFSAI